MDTISGMIRGVSMCWKVDG